MTLAGDALRWWSAAGILLVYAAMCLAIAQRQRCKRRLADLLQHGPPAAGADTPSWIIAYASQTGSAEELAAHAMATFHLAGIGARTCCLSALDIAQLGAATRMLFVVSTYGEGDAPDNAALFASRVMGASLPLPLLRFGVLALGDSSYRNFCGFGVALDAWLKQQGAAPLFARIDVDRGRPEALAAWRAQLLHQAGTADLPDWDAPAFASWTLAERRLLNPGSVGEPVYHLELEAPDTGLPEWESGDLVQIMAPGDASRAREYSIASIPAERRIHLLVRLARHTDGSAGLASGWLGHELALGAALPLRLRTHKRFRLEHNASRPLILIGNGTGIAGLRGHMKRRMQNGQHANWLIFGERNAASDFHYGDEIRTWLDAGMLQRADLAFSRDLPAGRYVQDCLRQQSALLCAWIADGAALYVCGSLKGMAAGVDAALCDILGAQTLAQLGLDGRYRRDVY